MLISHRYQFIFMKTKKTAGTSVECYFEPYCMAPDDPKAPSERNGKRAYISEHGIIGARGSKGLEQSGWLAHMPARKIREGIGEDIWSSYFRFATIRNPYEKAISAYFHQKHRRRVPIADLATERAAFEVWLADDKPPIDRDKFMIGKQYCLSDVIRFESLLPDLERICSRLGIPFEPQRLGRKKSHIRPALATVYNMYTDPGRASVTARYALDIELFGYGFPETKDGAGTQ
ncbi:sulfotransferase family protein [Thiohalocapsa marina]|uniref:Sulfotransferase family protein n=1 Tax=Thiohalocapsa marina TaxID=424902 RepID=A0A5M8FMD4_9GAMM|nr:sulfotransferase family 2 domain-containing protein [Thiohalocapsa marina]KAA6186083.1 sulfotransferase family protein [Thiohalocapsa marina]